MVLERYRPLIDDYGAFRAACDRRLPYVARVNTVKTDIGRARRALAADGTDPEPVGWNSRLLRLSTSRPGATWAYVHGWIYVQEEVSALSAVVLAPEPGERVFDPAAAPGSKTTQLGALMDDRGSLVANDVNLGRLAALRSNTERCGLTNVTVTNRDATNYPLSPIGGGPFDRALVDVPCSCEGTVRKNPQALEGWSLDHVRGIAGTQKGILRRAVQCVRPGGTVVYSTCTFAPEENEAVLTHVLEREDCWLAAFDAPIETRPGVREWEGTEYHPTVTRAKRIYPHLNDTGGFFCAKLEVGG